MAVMHTQALPGAASPLIEQEPERVAQIDSAAAVDASERSSTRLPAAAPQRINESLRCWR